MYPQISLAMNDCKCKECNGMINALRNLGDSVMDAQERMKDCDYRAVLDASKIVYEAANRERKRAKMTLDEKANANNRMKLKLIETMVENVMHEHEWETLTICCVRKFILRRSDGMISESDLNDTVVRKNMTHCIAKQLKCGRRRLAVTANNNNNESKGVQFEEEEEALFPIR